MAKTKVAILGGGVASLTAAHELTRTAELREKYEVTIYQMGWRLGGKGATGRNLEPDKGCRIEEHGLHIWLGFYHNAFATIQEVYKDVETLGLAPDSPFQTWRQAFKPQSFTPVGIGDGSVYIPVTWPTNKSVPGEGGVFISPLESLNEIFEIIKSMIWAVLKDKPARSGPGRVGATGPVAWSWRAFLRSLAIAFTEMAILGLKGALKTAWSVFTGLISNRPKRVSEIGREFDDLLHHIIQRTEDVLDDDGKVSRRHFHEVSHLVKTLPGAFHAVRGDPKGEEDVAKVVLELLDMMVAVFEGIKNPEYGLLPDLDLNKIDDFELMDWLVANGGSKRLAKWMDRDGLNTPKQPFIRALYDLAFAYEQSTDENGNPKTIPNFAAGAALRCIVRIVGTYREAVLFEMQSGMGEVVATPLYLLLKERGVKFEFFSKVKGLNLSENKNWIEQVEIERQASIVTNSDTPGQYQPTFDVDGLACWPSKPFWDQLVDGDKLRAAGVNFESNWCAYPPGYNPDTRTLKLGRDFDKVILGISLGAFKDLGNGDGSFCGELIEASPAFGAMTEGMGIVPTHAEQFWMTCDLKDLGWTMGRPAMVGSVEPIDVWADMTRSICREKWPSDNRPQSLHYFCGPLNTNLNRQSSGDVSVPAKALAEVRSLTAHWCSTNIGTIWPDATSPPGTAGLDWALLYGGDKNGDERLLDQYLRANVDPTECCVATLVGTTKLRLHPGNSGFINLYLAGTWTRTGLNTACVEAATMSGMSAARAITGIDRVIVGENFMQGNENE